MDKIGDIAWDEVRLDYLAGMNRAELMRKYKIERGPLNIKIQDGDWNKERDEMAAQIYQLAKNELTTYTLDTIKARNTQVERITTLALDKLESILKDENVSNKDALVAIGKAIEISGLKAINGTFQEQAPKKVFITKIDEIKVDKHIEDVINA